MDSFTPVVRNLDNHNSSHEELARETRLRRRVPSPFVYATSPIPSILRSDVNREGPNKHRSSTANNVTQLIRPISLAALKKVPGSHSFEPSETHSNKGNNFRRHTLSAQHLPRQRSSKEKDDNNRPPRREQGGSNTSLSLRYSQIRPGQSDVADFLYFTGKSNGSLVGNKFMNSSRPIKSGATYVGNIMHANSDLNNGKSATYKFQQPNVPVRAIRSPCLQGQLKLLSRPKLLPNFEASNKLQSKHNGSRNATAEPSVSDMVHSPNIQLTDPVIMNFKVNSIPLKPKDYQIFHRPFTSDSNIINFRDMKFIEASRYMDRSEEVQNAEEEPKKLYEPVKFESNEVINRIVAANFNSLEKLSMAIKEDINDTVKLPCESQVHYAVSVKNPTAQTVVLLRNQTNAYLRNAISSKLSTYEQIAESYDMPPINSVIPLATTVSTNNLKRAVENQPPTAQVTSTITIPVSDPCPVNYTTAATPVITGTPHPDLHDPSKQIEMDSGNGTDEDDLLLREVEDSPENSPLYEPLDIEDGSGDAEEKDCIDHHVGNDEDHEEGEVSDNSSGVPESDEDQNSTLSEDEESQSNEEAIITNATQTKASTTAEVSSDVDLSEPEPLTDELNDSGHSSADALEPAEQHSKDLIKKSTDGQAVVDRVPHSVKSYPTPPPPALSYVPRSSPSLGRAAMFSPFQFRSASRTPHIFTQISTTAGTPKPIGPESIKCQPHSETNARAPGHDSFKPDSKETLSTVARTSSPVVRTTPNSDSGGPQISDQNVKYSRIPMGEAPTSSNWQTDVRKGNASPGSTQTRTDHPSSETSQIDTQAYCGSKDTVVAGQKKTRKQSVNRQAPDKPATHPALIASLFPNVPPVIRFVDEGNKLESLPWEFRRLLRWRASMLTPAVVRQALLRSGFRVSKLTSATEDLETIESSDWIFYFGKHMRPQVFRSIKEYQKVNHLPCSFQLGRKDRLWKNLVHMQMRCGKENFNYIPQTFCLPADLEALKKVWDEEGSGQRWILKPPASARGIGVRLITKWAQVPKKRPAIVQKYLAKPFLINDSKFDLRIYVYISSINPLRVYIHEDGLVRFASQKYSNSVRCLGNRFIHLTNYSINRLNSEYVSNTNEMAAKGHKWSLRALWAYLRSQGISPTPVWSSIKDVVVKTAISTEAAFNAAISSYCNHSCSVHEVFGFDIFLDEDLQPWLLEVNVSPSMHSDSPLDAKIKGNMVRDMLNIAGLRLPEPSDTNSHTVIPFCVAKTAPSRNSSDLGSLDQQTPQPSADPNGIAATPVSGAPLNVSPTNLSEVGRSPDHRLKCSGDAELSNGSRLPRKVRSPSHEWLIDSRLHMTQLSSDEREKRRYYIQRAVQYELPRCTTATPTPGHHVNVSPRSRCHDSALGTVNNNYHLSPDRTRDLKSAALHTTPPSQTHSDGLVYDDSDLDRSTSGTPPMPHHNLNGCSHVAGIHSTSRTPSSASSGSDEDSNQDEDDPIGSEPIELTGANNSSKKNARSMGIGPSSPDLRSHRVTGPAAQVPSMCTGLCAQGKEISVKPPTVPPQARERAQSKNSFGMTGTSTTPTQRTRYRCASVGRSSEAPTPARPQTLPRVRLASATADILECLTPSDVRILIGMVDELERAGGFECIFPPSSAGLAVRYLSYFESPRYANLLCIAYLQKYAEDKEKGIELLRKHCEKNVHLTSSIQGDRVAPENQWQAFLRRRTSAGKDHRRKVASPLTTVSGNKASSTPGIVPIHNTGSTTNNNNNIRT